MRGGLFLLDEEGEPFAKLDRDPGLDLPIVVMLDVRRGTPVTNEERQRILDALRIARLYEASGLNKWDRLAEVQVDMMLGYTLVTEKKGLQVALGDGRIEDRLSRLEDVFRALDRQDLGKVTYVRLDGEGALRHVAIGKGAGMPLIDKDLAASAGREGP